LRAIADSGGVVHSVFTFLDADPSRVTLERVLDHMEYMVDKIGPEHVGIGSDFDGITGGPPAGLADATCLPKITEGLMKRGFPVGAVQAILGRNFLRVLKQVAG
jgi:membrane dipeptidase